MASSPRSRSRPRRRDLITRIHTDALHTPTTLGGAADLSNSQLHEDSSSSESDFQRSRTSKLAPRHARSRSNPFPSFLGVPKGRPDPTNQPRPPDKDWGDGNKNNMAGPSMMMNLKHERHAAGSKDFATGPCMTCASLMRWPKELKVFKCTICATINDLKLPDGDAQKPGLFGRRRDGTSHAPPPEASGSHSISIHHCRRIVRQCVHTYISNTLFHKEPSKSVNGPASNGSQSRWSSVDGNKNPPGDGDGNVRGRSTSKYVFEEPPSLRPMNARMHTATRSYSSSTQEGPLMPAKQSNQALPERCRAPFTGRDCEAKRIFKPLEDYIVKAFSSLECVNSSFLFQHYPNGREGSGAEQIRRKPVASQAASLWRNDVAALQEDLPTDKPIDELDAKTLLLGDIAENGSWWTGGRSQFPPSKPASALRSESPTKRPLAMKSPNIDWDALNSWYDLATNVAEGWFSVYEDICKESNVEPHPQLHLQLLEKELLVGQSHTQRVLLKATESLLKRPGRPISEPSDLRFLLIIAENFLLRADFKPFRGILQPEEKTNVAAPPLPTHLPDERRALPSSGLLSGQHSGIVKRIIGLLSNASPDCHNQLISWLARYGSTRFSRIKDLVSGFLSYRLLRQLDKKHPTEVDITAGLIPEMRTGRSAGGSYLHDEIRSGGSSKKKESEQKIAYTEDWQVRAASRVLALLFAANNATESRAGHAAQASADVAAFGSTREYRHKGGQLLPTSDFYNSMVDYADLVSDFESWESKRTKFSFCQYPFLMSIWAKTHILEHDARRQMQMKARDAFLDSIMSNKNVKQYLCLTVRRDCLVEDSLAAVSEVIGSGSEDIKKGLRISFRGEEGIDGGGLRKEWFLLLVREVFNPDHGMFLYDEDSQYCYFNPSTFETSDQFFLVGVVMGLAIYNSTILDVALPPFAFRKLLAAAPAHGLGFTSRPRPSMRYTLSDLAEYRPRVARGLRQLLEYEGDVEDTFCLDFVINTQKYGTAVQVPLCPGGEGKAVTNSNRREYVELYIRYLLDTAVTRQFEPFKRGFYTVCGGNAFSLFRPEEIELLIRGSDEALDIASLRAVAQYDNWGLAQPDGHVDVVSWFWETFQEAIPANQRKLLSFITGSDRIPATGAAMLPIKISCLGEDNGRFPIARTCFNMLSLWNYRSKERLVRMLWRAVLESEGFGLK